MRHERPCQPAASGPGTGSGGYTLTAVFSNALNLPMNAKVKLAGADVGQLESMVARNYTAVTTLRIRDGVRLPRGSTAELRTATPLGDVFVALKPPAAGDLGRAAVEERRHHRPGFDGGRRDRRVGAELGGDPGERRGGAQFHQHHQRFRQGDRRPGPGVRRLIRKSNQLLGTLDSRSDQISTALTELSRLADQLDAKNQTITDLMAAARPATATLADNTTQLTDLAVQAGDTARLLARFPSIGGTDTSGRSMIRDLNTIAGAANDVAVSPDTSWLSLNRLIPAVGQIDGRESRFRCTCSVDRLMLGSIPDIGFPGDIGLHGPHQYDWNQLVGSFKYTLWRLQERVVGRGPNSPQVPVIPDPNDPGQIVSPPGRRRHRPPPGPPAPGPPP